MNKVKIYKENGRAVKIELNGQELQWVTSIEIKTHYTPKDTKESLIIELSNISKLEIIDCEIAEV